MVPGAGFEPASRDPQSLRMPATPPRHPAFSPNNIMNIVFIKLLNFSNSEEGRTLIIH